MANRSVLISFITKFNNRGIKNATKDLSGMEKIGKRFSLGAKASFAAAGVAAVAFAEKLARVSVKAAIAEEKQLQSLSTALSNLGFRDAIPGVIAFTDQLQRTSGISEDILRPSLQSLITTTKDVAGSQEILKRAIDISRGSGKDLTLVVGALNKAFTGNLGALGRLNVGIDKNLIKSGDLSAIMDDLATKFGGQGAAAAETMAGKIDKLKVAAAEASETLGKGILTAIEVSGVKSGDAIDGLGSKLEQLATKTSNVMAGLAGVFRDIKTTFGVIDENTGGILSKVLELSKQYNIINIIGRELEKRGQREIANLEMANALLAARDETKSVVMSKAKAEAEAKYVEALKKSDPILKAIAAAEAKAKAAAAAKAKEAAAAAAKKKAEERQDQLKKQLAAKFDMDNIQLAAALRNATTAEEKSRVQALMAIKSEGYKDDEIALGKLNALDDARNKGLMTQAGEIAKLASADAARASAVASQVAELNKLKVEIPFYYTPMGGLPAAPSTATQGMSPFGAGLQTPEQYRSLLDRMGVNEAVARSQQAGLGKITPQMDLAMLDLGRGGEIVATQVYVTVQGNVFTENELIDAVANGLYERNRAGTNSALTNLGR